MKCYSDEQVDKIKENMKKIEGTLPLCMEHTLIEGYIRKIENILEGECPTITTFRYCSKKVEKEPEEITELLTALQKEQLDSIQRRNQLKDKIITKIYGEWSRFSGNEDNELNVELDNNTLIITINSPCVYIYFSDLVNFIQELGIDYNTIRIDTKINSIILKVDYTLL